MVNKYPNDCNMTLFSEAFDYFTAMEKTITGHIAELA